MNQKDLNRCSCKADDYSTNLPCERIVDPSTPQSQREWVDPSPQAAPPQWTRPEPTREEVVDVEYVYCEKSYLEEIDQLISAVDKWRDKYIVARDKNHMAQAAVDTILREITHDRVKEVKMLIALEENLHESE